ncbi:MAG: alpha/beta hydrolase [Candidatus Saccharimonadales bacterium]|nr:alpha/beta hydrolase [Candidatus Saccharimonadales bacterium]
MKRAVILHGTAGNPDGHWKKWLRHQLEERGYEVMAPLLPGSHSPNRHVYNDFLLKQDWDYEDNLIIGHSSGAVSILNILEDDRFPKIKTAVLIGAWNSLKIKDYEEDRFINLFPEDGFKYDRIKPKAETILFIHGDNDPWCPLEQAQGLAQNLESEIVVIPGGQHFVSHRDPKYKEFPELIQILEDRNLI